MKSKYLIFVGILLLSVGIALKYFTDLGTLPIILMATGGGCKLAYIILKLIKGEYKPGYEVILLLAGLLLFFTGRNLQANSAQSYALIMMMTGLGLKALFIVLFIRQIRMVRNQNTI